ncbi:hypothetical protein Acid345_1624 [Candidatus Koribacter versatilis Ellin345]|uniref:Sortilin N-terminal domain-containing protein n=1 Tax=Koribacter versatilis (strain Ellin345) TaxID=204669 RepID=Q1IR74_KORVE|nr:glycoside hydrolase [Candidatus Koribacter versatilis]ABF40626.1 hypothetical protein Acid345_1624 [Candidatus Koribacter versatilis Ellin345]
MIRLRKHFSVLLFSLLSSLVIAQQLPDMSQAWHWRPIGPLRGGRTRSVAGIPNQPNVFYIGVVNGGVWRTNDYGRTWDSIFDSQPTQSIGAIAVAPSDPKVIYVASGEGLHRPDLSVGDGIYKSTDAGKTWTHLGLRDGQQIPALAVDPRDPNKLLVAVAGHPYGPNPERGVFRSTDGGQTFQKVLYKDENVGASDVQIDPSNPDIVYAGLWESREGPWENGQWNGTGGGIYKSTDGGQTWNQLAGGLPDGIIQVYVAISPSSPNRLYASVATKAGVHIYGSKDAGTTWTTVTDDARPEQRIGGGDLPVPKVDPRDPETLYMTSTVTWKSTDSGKTWIGFRGAPGGDDYQNIWINPNDPKIICIVSDQGAIVTVNGGESWSSWYNQPTAQMYHVNTDNAFPYRVCSGQQESGSACVSSRGDDGQITFREWHPVAAEEYGYAVPDPLDPDIVIGGKLTRYDRRTGQAQNISPRPLRGPDFRVVRTEPIVFDPKDPHILYFAANALWKTTDYGKHWTQASPDLTRKNFSLPANIGKFSDQPTAKAKQRGVIYAVAISPLDTKRIWAGTDDGLLHITADGGAHWTDVTGNTLTPFEKVSVLEASHFDAQTAYAAINTLRLDILKPKILRTHDGGKTWANVREGIPDGETVNAVREDPKRKGLLFAATEKSVYASFDDGDHWQSLRLNLPASSVRDIQIHGDDLVAGTHGRGFWILDNISALREIKPQAFDHPVLFQPQTAIRVRWNMNTDTPLPPDEPRLPNPPDGAIIDYFLPAGFHGEVKLEIHDAAGKVLRTFSSNDPVPADDPKLAIPRYWPRPPQPLEGTPGMHRFLWDMHLAAIPGIHAEYPIAAVPHDTAPAPTSPWVQPGRYMVVLLANGSRADMPLTIEMDPRVKTATADLAQQFNASHQLYEDAKLISDAAAHAQAIREQLDQLHSKGGAAATDIEAFNKKIAEIAGEEEDFGPRRPGTAETLSSVRTGALFLMTMMQDADAAPTEAMLTKATEIHTATPKVIERWKQFVQQELPKFNDRLKQDNLSPLNPQAKVRDAEVELRGNEE